LPEIDRGWHQMGQENPAPVHRGDACRLPLRKARLKSGEQVIQSRILASTAEKNSWMRRSSHCCCCLMLQTAGFPSDRTERACSELVERMAIVAVPLDGQ
jgi:hypothetical protein